MAVVAYKCPNCGAPLEFSPESQKFECSFCGSSFTEEELQSIAPAQCSEQTISQASTESEGEEEAVLYTCPSCGAQIVTTETTAATSCLYCHSPVVLEGRLQGDFHPDRVIPFAFTREEAERRFYQWVAKKRYVPKGYFDAGKTEYFMGVYYPYWVLDCDTSADYAANANRIRVWRDSRNEYTETSTYRVHRQGNLHFEDLTRCALEGEGRELADGVMPYRVLEAIPFKMPYLSGFRAEIRNLESEALEPMFQNDVRTYTEHIMRDTVIGYDSVYNASLTSDVHQKTYQYALFPVWAFVYTGADQKKYYYSMNGQTGKIAGVLPLDRKKLFRDAILAGIGIAAVLLMIGGLMI